VEFTREQEDAFDVQVEEAKKNLKELIYPLFDLQSPRQTVIDTVPPIWVDQFTGKQPTMNDWYTEDADLDVAAGQYLYIEFSFEPSCDPVQCVIDLENKSIDFV
jgi:hypothetical protein